MIAHAEIDPYEVRSAIRRKRIVLAGNLRLKIFGKLTCASGKRMKRKNRIFFYSMEEAFQHGYRPCGSCMKQEYDAWKKSQH